MERRRQRGAAIITAMLVVTLASVVVTAMFWREHVTVRSVENRLQLAQARWIERAVIDWAKVILLVDKRNPLTGRSDHLHEIWATPVSDTRLDETVTAGASISDSSKSALLVGQMHDACARLNLNALVSPEGQVSGAHVAAYRRLLKLLGQPEQLADSLVARLLAASRRGDGPSVPALPLTRVADLRDVPGYEPRVLAAIEPFVVVLPWRPSPGAVVTPPVKVNLNTAPAEVIAAVMLHDAGDVDPRDDVLWRARQFVTKRESNTAGYSTPAEVVGMLTDGQQTLPAGMAQLVSFTSDYFLVRGMIRYDRVESHTETLLERESNKVNVIWQHRY